MNTMNTHSYEESMLDETISQLTSKLPTPPPRPASLASSTRSSKRSSTASSMTNPNMKHFETNASEAPPTPSIAEIYTTNGFYSSSSSPNPVGVQAQSSPYMSLGDELALSNVGGQQQQQYFSDISARSSIASTSVNQNSRDSGYEKGSYKTRQNVPSMASASSSSAAATTSNISGSNGPRKRSSKQHLRGEGPSIVIGVRGSPASSMIIESSAVRSSRSQSVSSDNTKPQRPPRSKRSLDFKQERERNSASKTPVELPPLPLPQSRFKRARKTLFSFFIDLFRASLMLWRQIIFPLSIAILGLIISPFQSKESNSKKQKVSSTKMIEKSDSKENEESIGKVFAEKFKFALCTSNLLTTSLSISSYESSTKPEETTQSAKTNDNVVKELVIPTSTFEIQEVRGMLRQNGDLVPNKISSSSPIELTKKAQVLLKGCLLSFLLSYPISSERDIWLRSSLLLASMVWGFIAVLGVRTNFPVQFEITHKPTGTYLPGLYDENLEDDGAIVGKEHLNEAQKRRIKDKMQIKLTKFIKACKSFDVECNKALAAVQETELISRGYKISHPLPPISRIEISHSKPSSSPPRSRSGSHPGSSITSRFSTNGRPFNSHLQALSSLPSTGESAPVEPIRMANVRRSLAYAFEDVNGMLKGANTDLKPLVDNQEMELLREMYELDDTNRRSSLMINETNDSNLQRGSWTSRAGGMSNSESTRQSSSPTYEDHLSSPRTPQNRDSLLENSLLDKFGQIRKPGENGMWDTPSSVTATSNSTGLRPGSRLSYISDKSPTNVTSFTGPNQNGALKRLSYSSAGTLSGGVGVNSTSIPFQRTSLQAAPRNLSGQNRRQGSVQLILNNPIDDSRPSSPLPNANTNMASPVSPNLNTSIDGYKIISLKASFEDMHSKRRRVLCCLLALDFTLSDEIQIETSPIKLTKTYWSRVGKIMSKLTEQLNEFAEKVRLDVQKEITVKKTEEALQDLPKRDSLGYLIDYSGFQDRLIAMGESLRSVQIKMRLCADELQMRGPPPLHGDMSEENSSIAALSEKRSSIGSSSEILFGTIREDLLQLSAEWEAATKIMRMNGKNTTKNEEEVQKSTEQNGTSSLDSNISNGNSIHPVPVGLLLESPQEAEEDAMREWVKKRTAHLTSDLSLEAAAIEAGLKQILDRANENGQNGIGLDNIIQDDTQESDKKIGEDLSTLLLRSTSPQSLPPPGIATVYEDIVKPAEQRKHSHLSREERIKIMKEQRSIDSQQLASHAANNKRISGAEMTNGMMNELKTVMKNRQSAIIDGKLQNQIPITKEDYQAKRRPSTSPTQQYAILEEHQQRPELTRNKSSMPILKSPEPQQHQSFQLQRKPATRKYTG